jgi:modification methylase
MITIRQTDAVDGMRSLHPGSVHTIFADPPYNIGKSASVAPTYHISQELADQAWTDFHAPWDAQWPDRAAYHAWTVAWLAEARRVLVPNGSIFICGSLHNIPTVGVALQDLGWYMNRWISWFKPNAFPNRSMTSLVSSTEIVIWARPTKKRRSLYHASIAKMYNGGKNLRDMWPIPFDAARARRLKKLGFVHPSKKPPALIERCLRLSAPRTNAHILDPFAGSGTTGEVALRFAHLGWTCTLFDADPTYVHGMQYLHTFPAQLALNLET